MMHAGDARAREARGCVSGGTERVALPLPLLCRGKVRDVYEVDADRVLLVASDRVSAFDVVMGETVPQKGVVLTQLSAWWFRQLRDVAPNHLIAATAEEIARAVPSLASHRGEISGRAMLCRRAVVFPVECVVRGYIAGSAWAEYSAHGTVAGVPLAAGLPEGSPLEPPRFTPATKAVTGHDENISLGRFVDLVGREPARQLERLTRDVYAAGRALAAKRGLIVADTKLEFGRARDGTILLVDELLTPDSSRFWPANGHAPGLPQQSLDKQPLRDYLAAERRAGRWNGEAPPPPLPPAIVAAASARYLDAYARLTGRPLDEQAWS